MSRLVISSSGIQRQGETPEQATKNNLKFMSIIFCFIGVLFLVIGVGLVIADPDEAWFGLIFAGVGIFWTALGIIIPKAALSSMEEAGDGLFVQDGNNTYTEINFKTGVQTIACPYCGSSLSLQKNSSIRCESCGATVGLDRAGNIISN